MDFLRSSRFKRTQKQGYALKDGWKSDRKSKRQMKLKAPEIRKRTKQDNFCSVPAGMRNTPLEEGVVRLTRIESKSTHSQGRVFRWEK